MLVANTGFQRIPFNLSVRKIFYKLEAASIFIFNEIQVAKAKNVNLIFFAWQLERI